MQEMQVLFVLVENIVDQLLLIPAHDIVVLAAFFQVDLRAIILVLLGLLFIVIQPGQSERRRTVAAQSDFIDKVKLIAQIDLETNAVFRSGVDAAERVLFTQLFLHQRHGRLDNLIHKALNQRAFWQIGDIAQPALPWNGVAGGGGGDGGHILAVAFRQVAAQRFKQAVNGYQQDGRERQCAGDGDGLQRAEPPAISKAMATMPISDAQKMRCQTGVLLEPPEASVSTTMAPESADVTKRR